MFLLLLMSIITKLNVLRMGESKASSVTQVNNFNLLNERKGRGAYFLCKIRVLLVLGSSLFRYFYLVMRCSLAEPDITHQ